MIKVFLEYWESIRLFVDASIFSIFSNLPKWTLPFLSVNKLGVLVILIANLGLIFKEISTPAKGSAFFPTHSNEYPFLSFYRYKSTILF